MAKGDKIVKKSANKSSPKKTGSTAASKSVKKSATKSGSKAAVVTKTTKHSSSHKSAPANSGNNKTVKPAAKVAAVVPAHSGAIPYGTFLRVSKELAAKHNEKLRFSKEAIVALQKAAEHYGVKMAKSAYLITVNSGRETLKDVDVVTACTIKQHNSSACDATLLNLFPEASIRRILKEGGVNRISDKAWSKLGEYITHMLNKIIEHAAKHMATDKRVTVKVVDIEHALESLSYLKE